MKKILIALFALILCVSFCACSDNSKKRKSDDDDEDDDKTLESSAVISESGSDESGITSDSSSEESLPNDNATVRPLPGGDDSSVPEDDSSVPEDDSTVSEDDATTPSKPSIFGTVEENRYENSYIGLGCNLDSQWYFYSDEEIKTLNGYVAGMLPEDYEDMLENSESIYDMYAINPLTQNNVIVTLNPGVTANPTDSAMTAYAEAIATQTLEVYESIGATDTDYTVGLTTIGSKNFNCAEIYATLNGISLHQRVIIFTVDTYMVSIAFSATNSESLDEIQSYFYCIG